MLNDIRRVFRKSLDAFLAEVGTRDPEDQVAELLSAMRRELVAAKAALPEYEEVLTRSRAELERERRTIEDCERRATLAERIGDAETAQIARDFATRHRERAQILEQKAAASAAELDLRRREADEMRLRFQQADANRFALLAQLRMTRRRRQSVLSEDDRAFDDFSRMEERVRDDGFYVDALGELDDQPPPARGGDDGSVDDKLRELKRKMGRE